MSLRCEKDEGKRKERIDRMNDRRQVDGGRKGCIDQYTRSHPCERGHDEVQEKRRSDERGGK